MNRAAIALLLALAASGAHAQFKIVGPDGSVTYTDRPPNSAEGRMAPLRAGAGDPPPAAVLPLALREPASRFPVTLYTSPECPPCEAGRALLRERGVPFRERVATAEADRDAWMRVVGSADAPALSIGGQWLRGFSAQQWHSYLDTAGYPRESRLPANYVAPAPAPLVERVAQPQAQPAPAAEPPPPQAPPPAEPGAIRF